tara:strand:+ start:2407 stop:2781 length:375 start_codon:yes stop_codon:yes gene_type:complete
MHQERTHHRRWHNREQSHEASRKDWERHNKARKEKQQAHEKMLEGLHKKLESVLTENDVSWDMQMTLLQTGKRLAQSSALSGSQRCGICEVINERSNNPHNCTVEILPIEFVYDALKQVAMDLK